jgi:hypothetical protein
MKLYLSTLLAFNTLMSVQAQSISATYTAGLIPNQF